MKIAYRLIPILLIAMIGCENDHPDSIYDPLAPVGDTPVISSMQPPDSSLAGVGELTIVGDNFSTNPDKNIVFFNTEAAEIIQVSETQLVVKTPNIIADSIAIRIGVAGAELFSNTFYYRLKPAAVDFGKIPAEDIGFGAAVDLNGNVYVSFQSKQILKITPSGETSVFANTTFLKANNMKMGPNNTIYAAVASGRIRKISTFDAAGNEGTFVSLPRNPYDLDFDDSGNIWVSVDKDIYLVKPDKTSASVASFDATLNTVRVFDGYLYFSGSDDAAQESKIWRAEIQGESLGDPEVVLDVTAATWLDGADVLCFTFASNGDMYLGTTSSPNGIFVYNPVDDSHDVLYPGLIGPEIYSMSWNETIFLYAVRQFVSTDLDGNDFNTSTLLRIELPYDGAPYYGRQ